MNSQNSGTAAAASSRETDFQDLFALTDEQILEMPEGEALSEELESSIRSSEEIAPKEESFQERRKDPKGESPDTRSDPRNTEPGTRGTAHNYTAPPKWLAERMADPQAGREARELWDGMQRARKESSAYRETFATPADARAAAERAKLLENIDRAYYTGDSGERTRLAETMLRENPAAFREMVETGLKLLQEATEPQSHGVKSLGTAFQHPEQNQANPKTPSGHAHEAQLAAYAAFERSANEDLERSVGSAITRTLDQALPNAARMQTSGQTGAQQTAPIQERLATAVRHDVETALRGDQQLGEQVLQILSSRRFDVEARAQVVRLIADRAQQLIPGAAKRVLSEWTQTTLAAHRGRNERSQSASARRDADPVSSDPRKAPGNRQTPGHQKAPNASHKVNYHSLSDEQILDL